MTFSVKQVSLGEVCEIVSSKRIFASEYKSEGIPFYRGKEISQLARGEETTAELYISEEAYKGALSRTGPVSPNDILLTAVGTLGNPYQIQEKDLPFYFKDGNVLWLRKFSSDVNPTFILYWLDSDHGRTKVLDTAIGSTQAALTISALSRVQISLPKLGVQSAIVETLTLLDRKIGINRSISKSLEAITQALFKSWFIDFDPVKAKMSGQNPVGMDDETASLFPDSLVESELGMIPSGWDVFPASELFEIGIGRTPPRKEPEWFSKDKIGVPWVSIRDMGAFGVFSRLTTEFLTEAAVLKFRVPVVPAQTVLMSFKLTVGKLCITDRPLVTNEAIAHFRVPTDGRLDSNYAYLWLSKYDMRTLDSTSSIGTATNSGVIRNIKFLVPSEFVLVKFQKTIEPIFKNLQLLQEQSATLAELRESLLARLVSGELQIPEEMLAS